MSKNEDSLPPDTFGIEVGGTYIMRAVSCRVEIRGKAHVFDGEIFTRLILPGKGSIGFILKPDAQSNLNFPSTCTQRNVTYGSFQEILARTAPLPERAALPFRTSIEPKFFCSFLAWV